MNNPIICDISRYQASQDGRQRVNFEKMRQAGAVGVIIRSSVGNYYTDPEFSVSYANATAAGLMVGVYHVIAPENTPQSQYDRFVNSVKGAAFQIPIVVDCELTRGCAPATITSRIQNFIKILEAHQERVMVYTRQSWWDPNVLKWSKWKNYPLMAARYPDPQYLDNFTGPWSDGVCKFRDWTEWKLWQFSADGNMQGAKYGCASKSVDLSYFNGTLSEFYAWCNATPPEPPAPPKACGVCQYPLQDAWNYCPMDGTQYTEAQG